MEHKSHGEQPIVVSFVRMTAAPMMGMGVVSQFVCGSRVKVEWTTTDVYGASSPICVSTGYCSREEIM